MAVGAASSGFLTQIQWDLLYQGFSLPVFLWEMLESSYEILFSFQLLGFAFFSSLFFGLLFVILWSSLHYALEVLKLKGNNQRELLSALLLIPVQHEAWSIQPEHSTQLHTAHRVLSD